MNEPQLLMKLIDAAGNLESAPDQIEYHEPHLICTIVIGSDEVADIILSHEAYEMLLRLTQDA